MASTEGKVIIRHAMREDIPTILQLIRELADYEHELDSVFATPETLGSTIAFAPSATAGPEPTTPHRPARCLLLFTPSGAPAAMALYFYNYSTWRAAPGIYLEDLFVRERERRKGYAGRLLGALAAEVLDMKGARLEWSVLKWNEPSIRFYEAVGAKTMSEWVGMRVEGEEGLRRLAGKAGTEMPS